MPSIYRALRRINRDSPELLTSGIPAAFQGARLKRWNKADKHTNYRKVVRHSSPGHISLARGFTRNWLRRSLCWLSQAGSLPIAPRSGSTRVTFLTRIRSGYFRTINLNVPTTVSRKCHWNSSSQRIQYVYRTTHSIYALDGTSNGAFALWSHRIALSDCPTGSDCISGLSRHSPASMVVTKYFWSTLEYRDCSERLKQRDPQSDSHITDDSRRRRQINAWRYIFRVSVFRVTQNRKMNLSWVLNCLVFANRALLAPRSCQTLGGIAVVSVPAKRFALH